MKIYTKTGDRGETALFDGSRVRKDDPRVDAYGNVDELNAFIGAAASFAASLEDTEIGAELETIQRDLFALGAQLADPRFPYGKRSKEKAKLAADRIVEMERTIDRFESALPPLRQFILPGGSPAGAMLHVARTVCRRAERRVAGLAGGAAIDPDIVIYLNRLSDFLFVLARSINHRQGQQENTW